MGSVLLSKGQPCLKQFWLSTGVRAWSSACSSPCSQSLHWFFKVWPTVLPLMYTRSWDERRLPYPQAKRMGSSIKDKLLNLMSKPSAALLYLLAHKSFWHFIFTYCLFMSESQLVVSVSFSILLKEASTFSTQQGCWACRFGGV